MKTWIFIVMFAYLASIAGASPRRIEITDAERPKKATAMHSALVLAHAGNSEDRIIKADSIECRFEESAWLVLIDQGHKADAQMRGDEARWFVQTIKEAIGRDLPRYVIEEFDCDRGDGAGATCRFTIDIPQ